MLNKFQLLIINLAIVCLSACNEPNDEIALLPSGFYQGCISVAIKKNSTKLNNQEVKASGVTEVCDNTVLESFKNGEKFEQRIYLFNDDYQKRNVISDATNLWYNNTTTIKHGEITYISYVNSIGEVIVRTYEHKSKTFGEEQVIWTFNIGDDHSAPVIEINEDNKIVLLFSFHSSPLFIATSLNALDISEFNITEIDSGYITYPNLFKLANNNFVVFFRKGFSGENSKGEYHKMLSKDGGMSWEESKAIISFQNNLITYAYPKIINENIYIIFSNLDRQTGLLSDIFYTYSADNSVTWFANDGFKPYITSDTAIKLLSQDNIRIHSVSGFQDDVLISYSSFFQEYLCCEDSNALSVFSINEKSSLIIGNGLINYYSDGLVFDALIPNLGFYISRDTDSTDKSTITGGEVELKPLRFNKLGEVEVDKRIARITPLEGEYPGKLLWLEIDNYISYQNFITNLSFPENL